MADRKQDIIRFLDDHDWRDAVRCPLAGDASFRRYERLRRNGDRAGNRRRRNLEL